MISVYDHGFLYGMGLFETFRTYEGKPFYWNVIWNDSLKAAVLSASDMCRI